MKFKKISRQRIFEFYSELERIFKKIKNYAHQLPAYLKEPLPPSPQRTK
jgi:hypothetical protein